MPSRPPVSPRPNDILLNPMNKLPTASPIDFSTPKPRLSNLNGIENTVRNTPPSLNAPLFQLSNQPPVPGPPEGGGGGLPPKSPAPNHRPPLTAPCATPAAPAPSAPQGMDLKVLTIREPMAENIGMILEPIAAN